MARIAATKLYRARSAKGALAAAALPGAAGEPGKCGKDRQWRYYGQADHDYAGRDGEDPTGVVQCVIDAPGAPEPEPVLFSIRSDTRA